MQGTIQQEWALHICKGFDGRRWCFEKGSILYDFIPMRKGKPEKGNKNGTKLQSQLVPNQSNCKHKASFKQLDTFQCSVTSVVFYSVWRIQFFVAIFIHALFIHTWARPPSTTLVHPSLLPYPPKSKCLVKISKFCSQVPGFQPY